MTIDIKQQLNDLRLNLRLANWQIARSEDKLQELQSRCEKMTSVITDMPSGGNGGNISDTWDLLSDMRDDYRKVLAHGIKLQADAELLLATISDEKYKLLLQLRYIDLLKWEEIADRLECDVRWVYRMHGKALRMLSDRVEGKVNFRVG